MTRSFSELTKDLSRERRERIEQRKEQPVQEMALAERRRAWRLADGSGIDPTAPVDQCGTISPQG